MVKRVPRANSDDETGVDTEDPPKSKSQEELDVELGFTNTGNPAAESSKAATTEGDEELAGTESKSKKIKEARPQILVTPDIIEWVNSLIAQGVALSKDASTEERLTYR